MYKSEKTGEVWVRPESMWSEEVVWPDGIKRPRFVSVDYLLAEFAQLNTNLANRFGVSPEAVGGDLLLSGEVARDTSVSRWLELDYIITNWGD